MSAHVTVDGPRWQEVATIQEALKAVLLDRFRIEHTTIQVECGQCTQEIVAHVSG